MSTLSRPSVSVAILLLGRALLGVGESFIITGGQTWALAILTVRGTSKANRIAPEVLAPMGIVPRHEFVPEGVRRQAYADRPLPIGYGQTISQPFIIALMTDLLRVGPNDVVLEIGTGSAVHHP